MTVVKAIQIDRSGRIGDDVLVLARKSACGFSPSDQGCERGSFG